MGRGALTVASVVVIIVGGGAAAWFLGPPSAGAPAGAGAGPSSQPATGAAAKVAIRNDWQAFFASSTSAQGKIALLQHGSQFAGAVHTLDQSPIAQHVAAQVGSVTVGRAGRATVDYEITLNGQPALQHQTGTAVLENGTWKVSDAALCSLLSLSGNHPPACASAAGGSGGA